MSPTLRARRGATVLVTTTVAALAAVLVVVPAGTAAADAAGPPAGRYTPIAPTRVYDTDTVGRPFGIGETRTIDLSRAFTAAASAVVVNLTAAGGSTDSFQTVYPSGTARPLASSLNELRGQVRANSVTVAVGQGGTLQNKIDLFNSNGTVRLVVDVIGWYGKGGDAGQPGTAYQPLAAPVRLFDTRTGLGPLTNAYPRNVGIATVDYGSPAVNKIIRAVAVNITVTEPAGPGYLALWDGYGAKPTTSSLNFTTGQTVANLAVVPVRCTNDACTSVTFSIFNAVSSSTQVIGDIQGMYATPGVAGGTVFSAMSPQRLVDTRDGTGFGPLGAGGVGTVPATTWGGAARAASLNVTAVTPTGPAFLTVWAAGASQPLASSLNARLNDIVPNAVQTRLGSNGAGFQVYNNIGRTNVVVDLGGVVVLAPGTGTAKVDGAAATPRGQLSR